MEVEWGAWGGGRAGERGARVAQGEWGVGWWWWGGGVKNTDCNVELNRPVRVDINALRTHDEFRGVRHTILARLLITACLLNHLHQHVCNTMNV
jgi:hypothetical protein